MIELLQRKPALELNETFASFIIASQQIRYDPSVNGSIYESGEIIYLNNDSPEPKAITQEESDTLNREAIEEYKSRRDHIDIISDIQTFKSSSLYQCTLTDIHTYASNLGTSIKELSNSMNWPSVIFLLDYSIHWSYQDNDYEPVRKALDYLKHIGVDQNFNGGINTNGSDLETFVEHLFWLVRCNGSLPNCYFSGNGSKTMGTICKQGNIHLEFYSEEEKNNFRKVANRIGIIEIRDAVCDEKFSETGSIEGRQITL